MLASTVRSAAPNLCRARNQIVNYGVRSMMTSTADTIHGVKIVEHIGLVMGKCMLDYNIPCTLSSCCSSLTAQETLYVPRTLARISSQGEHFVAIVLLGCLTVFIA
jgi:hypothetical protein